MRQRMWSPIRTLILGFSLAFAPALVLADDAQVVTVEAPKNRFAITFPGHGWALDSRENSGNSEYYRFTNAAQNLTASVTIEPAADCDTAEQCREFLWLDPAPIYDQARDIERIDDINGFSVLKFIMPTQFDGTQTCELNFSAHMVKRGYWIDMHLTKMPSTAADTEDMAQFLERVSVR